MSFGRAGSIPVTPTSIKKGFTTIGRESLFSYTNGYGIIYADLRLARRKSTVRPILKFGKSFYLTPRLQLWYLGISIDYKRGNKT